VARFQTKANLYELGANDKIVQRNSAPRQTARHERNAVRSSGAGSDAADAGDLGRAWEESSNSPADAKRWQSGWMRRFA